MSIPGIKDIKGIKVAYFVDELIFDRVTNGLFQYGRPVLLTSEIYDTETQARKNKYVRLLEGDWENGLLGVTIPQLMYDEDFLKTTLIRMHDEEYLDAKKFVSIFDIESVNKVSEGDTVDLNIRLRHRHEDSDIPKTVDGGFLAQSCFVEFWGYEPKGGR